MPAIGPAPRWWFWSHDIQPDQIADLAMPGMRRRRLMSYRRGAQADRRFAAFYYDDDGAVASSRSWLIDVDAATAAAHGPRAVSVSVDVVPDSGTVRYTLVLEDQPAPARAFHTDLAAAGVTSLLDGDHAVVDFASYPATYQRDGTRCFAAIVEPRVGEGSVFFPRCGEGCPTLRALGVLPVRARAYRSPGGWRLDVVGERARGTGWSVHVDVDADDVAQRLERQHGYPLDLDAVGHGLSVRFALIAAA
jgi:hypothetical protein